jgi:hypothetical protein
VFEIEGARLRVGGQSTRGACKPMSVDLERSADRGSGRARRFDGGTREGAAPRAGRSIQHLLVPQPSRCTLHASGFFVSLFVAMGNIGNDALPSAVTGA